MASPPTVNLFTLNSEINNINVLLTKGKSDLESVMKTSMELAEFVKPILASKKEVGNLPKETLDILLP